MMSEAFPSGLLLSSHKQRVAKLTRTVKILVETYLIIADLKVLKHGASELYQ